MPDPVDADSIATAAAEPKSATVDGQAAEAHSIPDQIAAAKFAANQRTTSTGKRPKPFMRRIVPPGAG